MSEHEAISVIDILSDLPIAAVLFVVAWRLLGILERVLDELIAIEQDRE